MGIIVAQLSSMFKKYFIIHLIVLLSSAFCWARVDLSKTRRLNLPEMQDAEIVSKAFTDRVVPKDVQEGESGSSVLSKMADNTVAYWWDTTPLRQSALGRAAESVEKKARFQGEIKGSNQVTHFFDLKVLVMQALAKFEYKGWFRAGINYDARKAASTAEITQPLAQDKDLVVSQEFTNVESTSRLSLKFNW